MSFTINKEISRRSKQRNVPIDKNTTINNIEGLEFLILQSLATKAIKTETAYLEIKSNIKSLLWIYQQRDAFIQKKLKELYKGQAEGLAQSIKKYNLF